MKVIKNYIFDKFRIISFCCSSIGFITYILISLSSRDVDLITFNKSVVLAQSWALIQVISAVIKSLVYLLPEEKKSDTKKINSENKKNIFLFYFLDSFPLISIVSYYFTKIINKGENEILLELASFIAISYVTIIINFLIRNGFQWQGACLTLYISIVSLISYVFAIINNFDNKLFIVLICIFLNFIIYI